MSSMAVAIRVFWVFRRSGTSRQNRVVLPSRLIETVLAPPSIRTVVFSRELPQTSMVGNTVTGGRGSRMGAGRLEVFFTAGVPVKGGRSIPSCVKTTSTVITPSASAHASMPLKVARPAPAVAANASLVALWPLWSVRMTRKSSAPLELPPNWTSPLTLLHVSASIRSNTGFTGSGSNTTRAPRIGLSFRVGRGGTTFPDKVTVNTDSSGSWLAMFR